MLTTKPRDIYNPIICMTTASTRPTDRNLIAAFAPSKRCHRRAIYFYTYGGERYLVEPTKTGKETPRSSGFVTDWQLHHKTYTENTEKHKARTGKENDGAIWKLECTRTTKSNKKRTLFCSMYFLGLQSFRPTPLAFCGAPSRYTWHLQLAQS